MTYTFKLAKRLSHSRAARVTPALLLAALAACAAPETTGPLSPPPTDPPATQDPGDTLVVAPQDVSLRVGDTVRFTAPDRTARGNPATGPSVWSATGGVIDSTTGLYSATSTGTYEVRVRKGGKQGRSRVTVSSAITIQSVSLSPASVTLAPGATQAFSATASYSDGTSGAIAVLWTATGGTIDSAGRYVAGNTAGSFRVIGTAPGGRADTAAVTIQAPVATLTSLVLNPSQVSLTTGGSRQFSVAATWSDGSTTVPSVTWSATGGTISSQGLYTAGNTAGTYRVIARHTGGTLADTSAVTVSQPAPTLTGCTISPATANLVFGQTQQYSTIGNYSNGTTGAVQVSYSATGGTISASGLYTAGNVAGTYRILAAVAATSISCGADAVVTAPLNPPPGGRTLQAVDVTPNSATLQTGATQQFSVSGRYSDGSTDTVSVTWSATAGSVSQTGFFTAPSTAGTVYVRAVSGSGGFRDSSAVSVEPAPQSGVDPTPETTGGTVLFDTRTSMQQMTTISQIRALFDFARPNDFFVDDADGSGTNARGWTNTTTNETDSQLDVKLNSTVPGTAGFYVQWKNVYRPGYVFNAGIKDVLLLRQPDSGTDRIYLVKDGRNNVVRLSIDNRNWTTPNAVSDFASQIGRVLTTTVYVQPSTGTVRLWENGRLLINLSGQNIGTAGVAQIQWHVAAYVGSGSTRHMWDYVVWRAN